MWYGWRMKPHLIAFAVVMAFGAVVPARLAVADHAPAPQAQDGPGLMQRGADLLFRQFLDEIGPKLDEMQDGLAEALAALEPLLRDLGALIDDLSRYEAPVILPNGDILIRRRPDAPPPSPPGATIEL